MSGLTLYNKKYWIDHRLCFTLQFLFLFGFSKCMYFVYFAAEIQYKNVMGGGGYRIAAL